MSIYATKNYNAGTGVSAYIFTGDSSLTPTVNNVTQIANPYIYKGRIESTTSIPANSTINLPFTTVYAPDNTFDNPLSIPVSGYYTFNLTPFWSFGSFVFKKNDIPFTIEGSLSIGYTDILYFEIGDIFTIEIINNTGSNHNTNGGYWLMTFISA